MGALIAIEEELTLRHRRESGKKTHHRPGIADIDTNFSGRIACIGITQSCWHNSPGISRLFDSHAKSA